MNDPQTIRQICSAAYQAITVTHQQKPELLTEKCRGWKWQSAEHESAFIEKLAARLDTAANQTDLITEIEQILRRLLMPPFFESVGFRNLLAQVHQLAEVPLENDAGDTETPLSSLNGRHIETAAISVLLLDAENLQLSAKAEKFLASKCTYPLRVKIAFANWHSLGKHDVEFHSRSYDLMHVPVGKDMADGKMIAIGTSIHEHYPSAKEVLVCSSDKVMTSLCTKLRQKGLVVYQVRKQDDSITLVNSETGETDYYSSKPLSDIISLDSGIAQIKELIKLEQQESSSSWVKLSRLSSLFRANSGCTITQFASAHDLGKRARDLFIDRQTDFVVYQPPEQSELYITLFEMPASIEYQAQINGNSTAPKQNCFEILTLQELELALTRILRVLIAKSEASYVDIGVLAAQFNTQHRQPITAVLKQLNLKQKYPAFLKSCKSLTVQPKGKGWQVTLR